ncbi:MAG: DUF1800 domain-containing protein [Planctomycetes bacterium]|nr:DUF1800 domain-containing protein [Planctomycetota bacterium]
MLPQTIFVAARRPVNERSRRLRWGDRWALRSGWTPNRWTAVGACAAMVCAGVLSSARAESGEAGRSKLEPLPSGSFDRAAAAHLLSRAGFGGTPKEIDELHALGLDAAVDRLLDVQGDDPVGPFNATLTERLARGEFAKLSPEERMKRQREFRIKDQTQLQQLRGWWLRRMVLSPNPLEEKMTLFWHGHFATSHIDVRNSYHMYLQNETLRKGALGSFKDLVTAIAKDPAMLEYLDNNTNNRNKPNENFARELMELFTLGVGNYTEEDIKEAARALTGWTFRGNAFTFVRFQHDPGEKKVLGKKGRFTGDDVIDVIFGQPAASRFVVRKLFVYFAHESPSDDVIESLAATFRENDFAIRPVLREMFRSAEFYSERSRGTQIQSPVQSVVRTLRLLELDPGPSPVYASLAGQMGQDLFAPPSVKGWDGGQAWISTSTMFDRRNYAVVMLGLVQPDAMRRQFRLNAFGGGGGGGGLGGRFAAPPQWDAQSGAVRLLGDDANALTTEQVVDRLLERFLLVPATPEARRELIELYEKEEPSKRLTAVIHLIVSSPQYQLG